MEEFILSAAYRGQNITKEEHDYFLEVFPPISLKFNPDWSAGFQMGEASNHREDKRSGKYRPMFHTFTYDGNHCYYQGINFASEVDSRPYVIDEPV